MAQKTNLNISPYYDDFNSEKNFYKVLFNPGRAVQARELTTLQSILQNQVESFGSHIFKEGSVVIPGNIVYDGQFYAVKLNQTNFGTDISLYIDQYIGKKITGQTSGVTATVQHIELIDDISVLEPTIYVKYIDSDNNFNFTQFQDGESLIASENITYGNTTINSGTPFASLISLNATSTGSAAFIGNGVYFVRGYFVNVSQQTLLLDYYTNTSSYRVGLRIEESIVTAKDDIDLYDNAKGFTNYAAPGSDRFKIDLVLDKKPLTDLNDTNFIELLRIENGFIKKIETKSNNNIIRDYLAQRTYDESGDYSVEPFNPSIHNSLNDRLGSNGLFFENETTSQRNIPSNNLMCVKISPGKAYVRGYDIEKQSTVILDVDKPRETKSQSNVGISFEMGNLLRVNNVSGVPQQKGIVTFFSELNGSGSGVGSARVYNFNLTDSAFINGATNWDLYLYDIQTNTSLTLNNVISSSDLPASSFVKGKNSGASGYAVSAGSNSSIITLRQTSGSFAPGEQISINGVDFPRTIVSITAYGTQNIKSIKQDSNFPITGIATFAANAVLERFRMPGNITQVSISTASGGVSTVTSVGRVFTGITTNTIVRYQKIGFNTETYNKVSSISSSGLSITLSGITTNVSGVFEGSLPTSTVLTNIFAAAPIIRNQDSAYLYTNLPNNNISKVNLSDSTLRISAQLPNQTITANTLTLSAATVASTLGISSVYFDSFDQEKYSVHYPNGTISSLSSDSVTASNDTLTIRNLTNTTAATVNVTLVKNNIRSKVKKYSRSETVEITRSKYKQSGAGINTSISDGLTYSQYYGLRVQDEEICLNVPDVAKVISIYESFNSSAPSFDRVLFTSTANVGTNSIVGENIIGSISNAVARIVNRLTSPANTLEVVYLTDDRFVTGETVTFEESNITTEIEAITLGSYKDVTNSYFLEKGQKDQYYDYSKIIRNKNVPESSKRLLIVYDRYTVESNDNGDVFTVLSYDEERFSTDIPVIGSRLKRASDTLDFRPRVATFDPNSTNASPFDFGSRSFGTDPKVILTPNESSSIGYDYYLGRVDRLYLDKTGNFILEKGVSSNTPKAPTKSDAMMEIATIQLPPYLYNPQDARIQLRDNRRYTMRDIGFIDNRVSNLERVTSLSFLEIDTQTLQIQDAEGRNRFKSGFFVDDFKNYNFMNRQLTTAQVNPSANELIPLISRNSIKSKLVSATSVTDESLDYKLNFELLDSNVQKTGNCVTLKYQEIGWIQQLFATGVENVNPFNVVIYTGVISLNPSVDNWVRTIQLPDKNINITNNIPRTIQRNLVSNVNVDITNPVVRETSSSRVIASIADGSRRGEQEAIGSNITDTPTTSTNTSSNTTRDVSFDTVTNTDVSVRNILISASDESFMRSRNTEFSVSNLKPSTRYYQFLDGSSSVDFVPKLVEISNDSTLVNSGSTGSFKVGETVFGSVNGVRLISFRLCTPNHKYGPFNSPTTSFNINPYIKTESLPSAYSQTTKILNIDTGSLAEEAQGRYTGYLTKGMLLVGQESGAVSYVSDLRLISDNFGDLIGTFFLRDANTIPTPSVRIPTGTKTFRITSSSTNDPGLPGSNSISFAETNYNSDGTLNQFENEVTTITNNLTTTTVTNLTTNTTSSLTTIDRNTETLLAEYYDPLAQSFTVGGNIQAPTEYDTSDDINGAFLTSVGLYFASKDDGNAPLRVEIRTVELGTPTMIIVGKPVILRPSDITISDDGETETKVTFAEPIYLSPGREYSVVIISAHSDKYEMWIAEMGKKTRKTQSLPNSESVVYSKQFALGSLFKSQNGSIWTANQYQDLKFKLYKAQFTSTTGTAFFTNPSLDESNSYVSTLNNNPIRTLPKTATLSISTSTNSTIINNILIVGRKISGTKPNTYGYIVGTGSSVSRAQVTDGGTNYPASSTLANLETTNIVGRGSGLRLSVNTNSSGAITGIAATTAIGRGYQVGDVVGIVTNLGRNSRISISSITSLDTLYLSGLQAESSSFVVGAAVSYYPNDFPTNPIVSLASTTITNFVIDGGVNSGNYIKINHFDHGMYSGIDKVKISNAQSSYSPTKLSAELLANETTSISVGSTEIFSPFEGINVGSGNTGYVLIGEEIIGYSNSSNGTLTIASNGRGIDGTVVTPHQIDSLVYKYEMNGVSLRRINKEHTMSSTSIGIDDYYIQISRTESGSNRSSDGSVTNAPELSFVNESSFGGPKVKASENINYDGLVPTYNLITPGSATSVNAFIRTVSGTSIDGNENSFVEQPSEPVQLNVLNTLRSVRLVASDINEKNQPGLSKLLRKKSFTTGITLSTGDSNLSPLIYLDNALTEFTISRLDSPIADYATDSRVNSILNDPHSAIYVSNTVRLAQPATSLKVILSAYRHESADFRVLYSLIKADSSEIPQSFDLFPGYDNLTLTTDQGYLVVDLSKNNGKPDSYVPPSLDNEFLEYQFTVDNLDLFVGYTIKIVMSGTNQARAPRIKDLRTIAVR
jgi:hypothetical protein